MQHFKAVSRPVRIATLCAALASAAATWAQQSDPAAEPPTAEPERITQTKGEAYRLPPAAFDEELAIGGEEIEADKIRSRMTVGVEVNGQGPYRFIVDSGADTSVVGSKLAARQGLTVGEPSMLQSMTASEIVDRVLVEELKLGPTAFSDLELPVLMEKNIGAEGMIGLDALVNQRLMMDFDARTISVDDGSTPAPVLDGVIIVRGRLQRSQLILTEVEAQGVKVDAVVDTGTEISIGNSALRALLVSKTSKKLRKVEILGVTGASTTIELAVIPELRLGSVTLRNLPIAFADVPPFEMFGISERPSLLLGTDLLENFRKVSLDFHDRKVRFQLKKCDQSMVRIRTAPNLATRIRAEEESACAD